MGGSKPLILYHGNCPDGTTAAMVFFSVYGDAAEYRAVFYGKSPPEDVHDREVYIVDFCYPPEQLRLIAEQAKEVTVLDHHKTAFEWAQQAKGIPKLHLIFDMQQSGAGLAQKYLNRAQSWWVDYVEDRDLWRFILPDSEAINAYIQSVPRTIESYLEASKSTTQAKAKILGEGSLRYLRMYVSEMKKQARYTFFGGHENIPIVNAPYVGISELVGALAEDAPFAIGWFMNNEGQYMFSLRSRGDVDVSKIAEMYHGGGHRGAAGFRTLTLPSWVTDASSEPG